jgi:predicted amidohydrolase YtcJ
MTRVDLVIRDVEIDGRAGQDIAIADGRILEIGPRLGRVGPDLDGRGGALIPGLADHHIHLMGLAAQAASVVLDGVANASDFATRITAVLAARPAGAWVRATGYHEAMAGELTRRELDAIAPRHRLRVQHQTGSLWILNSLAIRELNLDDAPPGLELDLDGRPTGRVWRGDAWLRQQIGVQPPPLAPIGRQLAAFGITHVTDASVSTDASAANLLAEGVRTGALPQGLTLMSGGPLSAPADGAFTVGPVKILLDDDDLPDLQDIMATIQRARSWGRAVAVHSVTAAELAITLAAFEAAGALPDDRVEHGGVIPLGAIPQVAALGLTVVTQPGFIRERGDRYINEVDASEHLDLYRCASLMAGGVAVAASSDAPYATMDPWLAMAAAADRTTRSGRILGAGERVPPKVALQMYLDAPSAPGRAPRRLAVGERADLCLLRAPLRDVLASPSAEFVRATLVAGRLTSESA